MSTGRVGITRLEVSVPGLSGGYEERVCPENPSVPPGILVQTRSGSIYLMAAFTANWNLMASQSSLVLASP
jgi:hypothetical protein